ncbi:MAG: MBOAT family O-acyltransferase [Bacteroidota bacterium]|nr:MBOAT family O-acyltransferase [Bacteroidota bacterium]
MMNIHLTIVLLLIAAFVYTLLPFAFRKGFLLLFNAAFLLSFGVYGAVIFLTVAAVAHFSSAFLHDAPGSARKATLWLAVAVVTALFFLSKGLLTSAWIGKNGLFGFGAQTAGPLLGTAGTVGLSYYSFRALGYIVDRYHRRIHVLPFRDLCLYLSFFPHFLSGPIEKAGSFFSKLSKAKDFDYRSATDGLLLIAWGVFQKTVVADRLGVYVDTVYSDPGMFGSVQIVLATVFYSVQIYCDFCGYTNIAIGLCTVMGFESAVNFKQPYAAGSISDFWSRWHISLSQWLRDYVFLPLSYSLLKRPFLSFVGGKTRERLVYAASSLSTMFLCGLWHGSRSTYLLWGILHGAFLSFGRLTAGARARMWYSLGFSRTNAVRSVLARSTVFALVLCSWAVFRAGSGHDVISLLRNVLSAEPVRGDLAGGLMTGDFLIAMMLVPMILSIQWVQERAPLKERLRESPLLVRWALYIALILSIQLLPMEKGPERFIYIGY